ncbi:MAG: hypothetical protein J6X60_06675, partial [Ruminiclostridium sp.]|nr:hypothetical protein [Ruminiclostridium sp.]
MTAEVYDENDQVLSTFSTNIKLTIKSKLNLDGISIDSYKVSSKAIKPGDKFDVEVTLRNNSGLDVKKAELQLSGLDSSKFILDKGFSKQYVDIKKGEVGTVTFSLIAQEGIAHVRENLTLELSYTYDEKRADMARQTSTQLILECVPKEAEKTITYGAHDLSITDYSVNCDSV